MALPSQPSQGHLNEEMALLPSPEAVAHYLAGLRACQAQVCYPVLLQGLWNRPWGILTRQERGASGLLTVAVEHHALSQEALRALGEFRLQQYLLCGWYDAARVLFDQAQIDPQLATMPASSIHIVTGTTDGQILAYCALQGATHLHEDGIDLLDNQQELYLSDFPRPLFASEREFFGPALFTALPALRAIPLTAMGDLTYLLRNQAVVSPLSVVAVIDVVSTMIQLLIRPASGLQAILGAIDLEARRLLADLKVPILYAPQAPVVVNSLPYKHYWAAGEVGVSVQGKYWPFAVAVDDLRGQQNHFATLDQALFGTAREASRTLIKLRKQSHPAEPCAFVPPVDTPVQWTPHPF